MDAAAERRRGRAARHAGGLPRRRSARTTACSRCPATSPTPSAATRSSRALRGLDVFAAARRAASARGWRTRTPTCRRAPGRPGRHGHPAAHARRPADDAAAALDDARRRARPGRGRRLVGARAARPGVRARALARRTDVHADDVRRHPARARRTAASRSATGAVAARRRHRRGRGRGGGGHRRHRVRPGLGGGLRDERRAPLEPSVTFLRPGRLDRTRPTSRGPRHAGPAATGRPSTSAAARAGSPRRSASAGTSSSASTSTRRRSAGPYAAAARRMRRDVFAPLPGEGRWCTALLADGNVGIGGDPVALLRRLRAGARPARRVVVELAPPGTEPSTGWATLSDRGQVTRAVPLVGRRRRRHRRPRPRGGARRRPGCTGSRTAGAPSWRAPHEAPRATDRGRLHHPACAAPAVAARVGLWLGICFGDLLPDRAGQPLRAEPRPPGPVPGQPVLGLPGHPGPARHHRHGRGAAAAGEAVDASTRGCSSGPRRSAGRSLVEGARAGARSACSSRPRSSSWPPAWRTRRSGTRGASRSGPPTTRWPGSRSAPWSCTSR